MKCLPLKCDVDADTNLCRMEDKLRLSVLYKEMKFLFRIIFRRYSKSGLCVLFEDMKSEPEMNPIYSS